MYGTAQKAAPPDDTLTVVHTLSQPGLEHLLECFPAASNATSESLHKISKVEQSLTTRYCDHRRSAWHCILQMMVVCAERNHARLAGGDRVLGLSAGSFSRIDPFPGVSELAD